MNNIEKAKQALGKSDEITKIISNPKKKSQRLPLQRDINMVEQLLNDKIYKKEKEIGESLVQQIQKKYSQEIHMIHAKAVDIKNEAIRLGQTIEAETNGKVKAEFLSNNGRYNGSYMREIPDNITEAQEAEFFESEKNNFQSIIQINKEKDDYLLNLKIGVASLADVKQLLDKIDQIKS